MAQIATITTNRRRGSALNFEICGPGRPCNKCDAEQKYAGGHHEVGSHDGGQGTA